MELTNYIKKLISHNDNSSNDDLRQLIHALNIIPTYPIILIGGTNGKGSTCEYLSTMLTNAGYKVGKFTSPHVLKYNERICINNQEITDYELVCSLKYIIENSTLELGLFKTFTLACHWYFIQQKIDIAIFEVGIGGRQDITNLFEPAVSAITSIGLDHCSILGNNCEQIGYQKAGIYRTNKPAFLAAKDLPISIKEYSSTIKAELKLINQDFGYIRGEISWDYWDKNQKLYSLPMPSLRGTEQLNNASLAIAILKALPQFPVNLSAIKYGLLQTKLIGRFQVLPGQPQIILDTAHNPQAVSMMLENMLKLPFTKKCIAIFAIAQDKDYEEIIKLCNKVFDEWHIAPLPSARSIQLEILKQQLYPYNTKTIIHKSIKEAIISCYNNADTQDRIVCFGSFLVVEEVYKAIKEIR